jgi:hypothetical protein
MRPRSCAASSCLTDLLTGIGIEATRRMLGLDRTTQRVHSSFKVSASKRVVGR